MMKLKEESLIFESVCDDEHPDFDEDQRSAWLGIFADHNVTRIVMSGKQTDGRDVGEVEARLNKEQLIQIRNFLNRQIGDNP